MDKIRTGAIPNCQCRAKVEELEEALRWLAFRVSDALWIAYGGSVEALCIGATEQARENINRINNNNE
jgi:ligand-binding sensor domain-containing protein